jgi:hypothetical protein
MIISGNKNKIERGGDDVVESHFKIKATGKAFKILSDGLYSDKPLAIVRELCCNAHDAHIAAGKKDVPFTVHLPTQLEPYFSVRDEGIGLSKTQIAEIVTTFFESTKSESNDFIGALGLGFKSPFSYVDSFTVVSRYNGHKYSFNAFLNEDDIPSIALLFEEETTEGNGVEVTMPVKAADIGTFYQKTQQVLEWFSPLPNVVGIHQFTPNSKTYAMEGQGWKFVKEPNIWGRSKCVAVQGVVSYPISAGALEQHLNDAHATLLNYPFVLNFEIGELEVAASREHLSYKQATIESIKRRLDQILDELPSKLQSRIDECETLWDAHIAYEEAQTTYPMIERLAHIGGFSLQWNGESLKDKYVTAQYSDYPGLVVTSYHHRSAKRIVFDDQCQPNSKFRTSPSRLTQFFVNDVARGAPGRVKLFHKTTTGFATTYNVECADKAVIESFLNALGNPKTRNVSELPKPVVKKGIAKSSFQKMALKWKDEYEFKSLTDSDEVDLDEGGFYVPLFKGKPVATSTSEEPVNGFSDIVRLAIKTNIIKANDVVFGVTRAALKKVEKDDDWVNLITFITEKLNELIATNDLAAEIASIKSLSDLEANTSWRMQWFSAARDWSRALSSNSPFREFVTKFEEIKSSNAASFSVLVDRLNIILPSASVSKRVDFENRWIAIIARYPLLGMISSFNYQTQPLIDYINMVDLTLAKQAELL